MPLFASLRARAAVLCALAAVSAATLSARAAEGPSPTAAAPTTDAEPSSLLELNQADRDLSFPLEEGRLHLNFKPGAYLSVLCAGAGGALAAGALPRLRTPTRVGLARVGCAPPPAGYRALLARLGVELVPLGNLSLALPPAAPPLSAAHLAGLQLDRFTLSASSPAAPPPAPRADLLRGAPGLRALELRGVPLPRDALDHAPASLSVLVGLAEARVPAALLQRLTALEAKHSELEGDAPLLRTLSLTLRGAGAPPSWARFPALRTLSLTDWAAGRPEPWQHCAALRTLRLTKLSAEALPERWLEACGALRDLDLRSCRVGRLPSALLEGAGGGALVRLSLRYCSLSALPERLLDAVPSLLQLDLTGNKLHQLPSGVFARSLPLQTLVLARNQFADGSVFAEVGALRRLLMLDLSLNPRLPDACPGDPHGHFDSGESPLRLLQELRALNLSFSSVSRVCRDWRENMPRLHDLKLSHTRITRLSFNDLQHKRDSATSQRSPPPGMELYGTPLASIEYSAEDELRAASLPPARFELRLSAPLRCDCRMSRAARALRRHPHHLRLRGALLCAAPAAAPAQPPRALLAVDPDDMLCASPAHQCPANCTCAHQERGLLPDAPSWRVRVSCERAGLRALPALPARPSVQWDLRLAGNRIEELDRLPGNLTILDLRNNSLRDVSPRAAAAMRGAERVWLAGNPLRCGCALLGDAPLVRMLSDAGALCDGRDLPTAVEQERARCLLLEQEQSESGGALLGGGVAALGAVLVAALAAGAALASPARRVRVKGTLVAWGWLPRGAEPDDGRPYDAFVSFSAADEAAARRIVAQLESGAAPLRLCLHSRDWTPGEYIGAQIAASVRNARRTLVLVSRHFLASGWARAEFREAAAASARAAAPHLVLVFLEPPAALPLDRELRRFLETNTYIEADNPNFWKLLRRAMPPPRERNAISAKQTPPSLEPQPQAAEPALTPGPDSESTPASTPSPSPTAAPAITRSPPSSPAPADTRSPPSSPAPADTRSPPSSPAPADTRSPPSSPAPADTRSPPSSPAPADTRSPPSSPAPADTRSPPSSPAPADTRSPPSSPAPADTRSPPSSPAPADTRSPPSSPVPEEASKCESSSDVSESSSYSSDASWESLPRTPPAPPPAPWAALPTPTPTPTPA